ncbi:hypothetical protein [Phenylobacterium sp.]
MTHPTGPIKAHPSPWAVALFLVSSGFALVAMALCSTGFSPG